MYTKARIAGHPIHPMLVAFPIGLYGATVAALLAFIGTHDSFFFRAAMTANIAGVAMAAIAAIPGAIDLLSLPRSKARTLGFEHAGFNLLALASFAASAVLLYGRWEDRIFADGSMFLDATTPLALGLVGLVCTVIAGGLGWALVQTHHVGVKPGVEPLRRARRITEDEDYGHAQAHGHAREVTARYESHVHH